MATEKDMQLAVEELRRVASQFNKVLQVVQAMGVVTEVHVNKKGHIDLVNATYMRGF